MKLKALALSLGLVASPLVFANSTIPTFYTVAQGQTLLNHEDKLPFTVEKKGLMFDGKLLTGEHVIKVTNEGTHGFIQTEAGRIEPGQSIQFDYEFSEDGTLKFPLYGSTLNLADGNVPYKVEIKYLFKPQNDTVTAQQGATTEIPLTALFSNDDMSDAGTPQFKGIKNQSFVNVGLSPDGKSLMVSPLSRYNDGTTPTFDLLIKSSNGSTSYSTTSVNLSPLDDISAFVFTNQSDAQEFMEVYEPPTMLDIFEDWPRMNGSAYYPNKAASQGDASVWFMNTGGMIQQPRNVNQPNVIVSSEKLRSYIHEVTLTSSDSDDDGIGLVMGHDRQDNGQYVNLVVVRAKGGIYRSGLNYAVVVHTNSGTTILAEKNVGGSSGGWSSRTTRVKVQRDGDVFKVWASPWNSEVVDENSLIEINLDDYPALAALKGEASYGYHTHSQRNSTYRNVQFEGGAEYGTIFVAETNTVYKYSRDEDQWFNAGTIQDNVDYPRTIEDIDSGQVYTVSENGIAEK